MSGWVNFALAYAAFFASHAIPAAPRIKGALKARLGRAGYGAAFSLLSMAVLVWLIAAAGQAPWLPLWDQTPAMRWVANIVMPLAVALAVFAAGAPNPLSFGGRAAGFDPAQPGIAGLVRHPLLWALLLWSAAHLLVNGDLAHVILFGSFAGFCIAAMPMLDARRRRELGPAGWQRLAARSPALPFAALLSGRWRPRSAPPLWRAGLAVAVWAALLAAHPHVIGVSPLP
jgi:uncharacterized membrane protein